MKFTEALSIIAFGLTNLAQGLAIHPGTSSIRTSPLRTRGKATDPVITCTDNQIDYVEAQHAAIDLGNYCAAEGTIDGYTKSSAVDAKTRVYVCNYSTGDGSCSHDEIVRAQNAIASKCGLNRSGSWYNPDTLKQYGMEKWDVVTWCDGLKEHDPAEFEA